MKAKPWWVWVLVLLGIGLAKAGLHMLRLIILLALGLGALYMLHLLARDFNKIRMGWPFPQRPGTGGRFLGLFKRSTDEVDRRSNDVEQKKKWLAERLVNDTREFPHILDNDPIGCARKYVCHISGKSRAKLTRTADNILALLRAFQWMDATGEWVKAEQLGKSKAGEGACETNYPKCSYTGVQLEKFMSLF